MKINGCFHVLQERITFVTSTTIEELKNSGEKSATIV